MVNGEHAGPLKSPAWLLLPVLLVVIFHFPAIFCDFVWDDVTLIQKHPLLATPGFETQIFVRDYGEEFGSGGKVGYYRPFLMLLNVGLYRLFGGPCAFAYHSFSLLVMCITTAIVTLVSLMLLGKQNRLPAVLAGCLYAIHPGRTEVATFFMSLPDLLVELFTLSTIVVIMIRHDRAMAMARQPFGNVYGFLLCGLLTLCSGLSKETGIMTATATGIVVLLYCILNGEDRKTLVGPCSGIFAGLAVAVAMAANAHIVRPSPLISLKCLFMGGSGRAINAIVSIITEVIIPLPAVFLRWEQHAPSFIAATGIFLIFTFLGSTILYLVLRKRLVWALLTSWIAVALLNICLVTAVNLAYSQRYFAFAPVITVLCFACYTVYNRMTACSAVFSKKPLCRSLVTGAILVYLTAFGAQTLASSVKCIKPLTFFTFMTDENPGLAYPKIQLAKVLFAQYGDFDGMEKQAEAAISILPDDPGTRELGKMLATRCYLEGNFARALEHISWAGEILKSDADLCSLKALCLSELGKKEPALKEINIAMILDPANASYKKQHRLIMAGKTNLISRVQSE